MKLIYVIDKPIFKRVGMRQWLTVDVDGYLIYVDNRKTCDLSREDILADDWQTPEAKPPALIEAFSCHPESSYTSDHCTFNNHGDKVVIVKVYSK